MSGRAEQAQAPQGCARCDGSRGQKDERAGGAGAGAGVRQVGREQGAALKCQRARYLHYSAPDGEPSVGRSVGGSVAGR